MLELLDVAIGLIFVFLLLALIASALGEWISALASLRGRMLWDAIGHLVGERVRDKLGEQKLVEGLAQRRPSYLAAEVFTLALIQQVLDGKSNGDERWSLTALRERLHEWAKEEDSAQTQRAPVPRETIEAAKKSRTRLAQALLALIDDAADLEEAKRKISAWYDEAMTRLSGIYKRRMQAILFGLGLVLASALGVDACAIGRSLWENPSLRTSTVELAVAFAETAKVDEREPDADPQAAMERHMADARSHVTQLQKSRLPLESPWDSDNLLDWLLEHGFGVLLSALATSMGAAFWFDALGRVINLRTSIKPLPKRQDEASSSALSNRTDSKPPHTAHALDADPRR